MSQRGKQEIQSRAESWRTSLLINNLVNNSPRLRSLSRQGHGGVFICAGSAALFQLHRPTPCGRLPSGLPSPVLGPQDRRRKTGSTAEAAPDSILQRRQSQRGRLRLTTSWNLRPYAYEELLLEEEEPGLLLEEEELGLLLEGGARAQSAEVAGPRRGYIGWCMRAYPSQPSARSDLRSAPAGALRLTARR